MKKRFNIKEWQEKHLLKESVLGELPSDKLMKMKWNPVTQKDPAANEVFQVPSHVVQGIDKKLPTNAKQFKKATANLVDVLTESDYSQEEIKGYLKGYVDHIVMNA